MWLATKLGFYSIVHKPSHLDDFETPVFHIRARDKADLERLTNEFPGSTTQIFEFAYSDYPYRIIVPNAHILGKIMTYLGDSIDYGNFKDEIERTSHQKAKLNSYKNLWRGLYDSHEKKRPK